MATWEVLGCEFYPCHHRFDWEAQFRAAQCGSVLMFQVLLFILCCYATIYRVARKPESSETSSHFLVIYILKLSPVQFTFCDAEILPVSRDGAWQQLLEPAGGREGKVFPSSLSVSLSLCLFLALSLILSLVSSSSSLPFSLNSVLPQHWPHWESFPFHSLPRGDLSFDFFVLNSTWICFLRCWASRLNGRKGCKGRNGTEQCRPLGRKVHWKLF